MWIRSNSNRFTGMDARMARNPSLTLFVWDRSGPMHLDRASSFRSDYYRLLVVEKCRCVVRRGLRMLQDLDTRIVSRPLSQIGLRMLEKFWLLLQVWSTGYVRVLDFNWRNLILLSSLFADIWYHEWLRCSTCERNLFSIYFSYAQINNRNEFFRIEYFYQKIILFIRKNRYIQSRSFEREPRPIGWGTLFFEISNDREFCCDTEREGWTFSIRLPHRGGNRLLRRIDSPWCGIPRPRGFH